MMDNIPVTADADTFFDDVEMDQSTQEESTGTITTSTNDESKAAEVPAEADAKAEQTIEPRDEPKVNAQTMNKNKQEEEKLYPVVDDPYDFEKCQITICIALLPSDGDPRGRDVIVAAYNHDDEPLIQNCREADLGPFPKIITDMLDELKKMLPERAAAYVEEKRKETEEKEKRKTVSAKSKKPRSREGQAATSALQQDTKQSQPDLFGDLMNAGAK